MSNFARQIVAFAAGTTEAKLETGDLSACRDLTDVRDVVQAYWLLLERGRSGEIYNIGTGTAVSMETVVRMLGELANSRFVVHRANRRLRPAGLCAEVEDELVELFVIVKATCFARLGEEQVPFDDGLRVGVEREDSTPAVSHRPKVAFWCQSTDSHARTFQDQ